jgi:hypothetical protein
MKKLVLLLMLVSVSVFAQEPVYEVKQEKTVQWQSSEETDLTEKEYKYLTAGIEIQKKGGFDMIAGYEFQLVKRKVYGDYLISANSFIKTSEKIAKAISIEVTNQKTKKTIYLALPIKGDAYSKEYVTLLYSLDATVSKYMNVFLSDVSRMYYEDYYKKVK